MPPTAKSARIPSGVGTTASVICRLEDADDDGHSLFMLRRRLWTKRSRSVLSHQSDPKTLLSGAVVVDRFPALNPDVRRCQEQTLHLPSGTLYCKLSRGGILASTSPLQLCFIACRTGLPSGRIGRL